MKGVPSRVQLEEARRRASRTATVAVRRQLHAARLSAEARELFDLADTFARDLRDLEARQAAERARRDAARHMRGAP